MTTRFAPLRGITLAVLLTLGVGQGLMFGMTSATNQRAPWQR